MMKKVSRLVPELAIVATSTSDGQRDVCQITCCAGGLKAAISAARSAQRAGREPFITLWPSEFIRIRPDLADLSVQKGGTET